MDKKLVLCVRLSSLGDIINTFPAVALLKDKYRIHFLTESRFKDLVVGNPMFEDIHVVPLPDIRRMIFNPFNWVSLLKSISDFAVSIRKYHYDIVYDFHSSLKSVFGILCVKADIIRGYGKDDCYELAHIFYDEQISTNGQVLHRQDKFARLVGENYIRKPDIILPPIPDSSKKLVLRFLTEKSLEPKSYIIIHAGTSNRGIDKRWNAQNWIELIKKVHSQFSLLTILTWGKGEYNLVNYIHSRTNKISIISPFTKSLHDLRAIINNSALFVSCDTGPLHLACADKNLCVGLFGPKDPRVYAPRGDNFRLICSKDGSVGSITAEDVLNQLKSWLDDSRLRH